MFKLLILLLLNTYFALFAKETVICVHGFMRGGRNMSALANAFEREGYRVVNWSYPSREKKIEEHAADLVKELKATLKPEEPIHFVTHSMGGLIVRAALSHPECPLEAKQGKAVLIAPPNNGSIFARRLAKFPFLLGHEAGRQLMTLTHFEWEFPAGMPVLVIAGTYGFNPLIPGKNDGKVSVEETRLTTPHTLQTVRAGHSWICHWPPTIQKALRFLNESAF